MKNLVQHIRKFLIITGFILPGAVVLMGQCVTGVINSTDITCAGANDGIIVITDTEGESGSFEYSIDGGNIWQVYNVFTGLGPGIYNVQIRDAKTPSCVFTLDQTRSIREPDPLYPGAHNTTPLEACINYKPSTLILSTPPTGGRPPYYYQWFLNGNAISGETSNSYNPPKLQAPGTYTYYCIVTDVCRVSAATASKTITIVENSGVTITGAGTFCQDDPVTLSAEVSGVTGMITYQWQYSVDNVVWNNIDGADDAVFNVSTSKPGEIHYRVNLTVNGAVCNDTASVTVEPLPVATVSGTTSVCMNATFPLITFTGTGGTLPYNFAYNINAGENRTISTVSQDRVAVAVPTGTEGDFSISLVYVSDAKGCSQAQTGTAVITVCSLPTANIEDLTNVLCYGDSTGTATVTAAGGTGPYTYTWGTTLPQNTSTAKGLAAGTFSVTVTDANGCQDTGQVTITQPKAALVAVISAVTDVDCLGDATGDATVSATGGTGSYTYRWNTSPVQNSATASGLGAGRYEVTVTDINSCSDTVSVRIKSIYDSCLTIPEAFSPNEDGINDLWKIEDMYLYPDAVITIYNRWNKIVWRSEKGYPHPWDGTSAGIRLPVDSYHYVIELKRGSKPILGHVTIVM